MSSPSDRDHYSYTVYRDPATARTFDDQRFGGPIGELVASEQAQVLANFAGRLNGRSILDVGAGTGRTALFLARGGARVTAVDASEAMLEIARRRAASQNLRLRFLIADAHSLEFADRSFDVAISLRVLMHTPKWRQCVAELCRVADRLVTIDYPSATSFAVIESLVRRVTYALGAKTEPYRVFRDRSIARELEKSGFSVRSVHRQFALPIAFHKMCGSRRFTRFVEGFFDRLGLLRVFGSPVTLVAER